MSDLKAPADLLICDGIATVSLNNPKRRNPLNAALLAILPGLLDEAANSAEVSAILLRAEGPVFCSGGDLMAMIEAGDEVDSLIRRSGAAVNAMMRTLHNTDKIVIAAVRGAAAGAGIGLVAAADIAVAADDAQFATAYASFALTPDAGLTYSLPRTIGMRAALELCLRSDPIDAVTALELGLVSEVVVRDEVDSRALMRARQIASGPSASYHEVKRLLKASRTRSYSAQLDDEIDTLAVVSARPEFRDRAAQWLASVTRPKDPAGTVDGI